MEAASEVEQFENQRKMGGMILVLIGASALFIWPYCFTDFSRKLEQGDIHASHWSVLVSGVLVGSLPSLFIGFVTGFWIRGKCYR